MCGHFSIGFINYMFLGKSLTDYTNLFSPNNFKERKLMNKKLSKYISFFDYFDKSLIVLSVTSGGVSIASFATSIGAPIGITSASLSHFHCVQD